MTIVKFLEKQNRLCGFEISGHSTEDCDDTNGKIVCSAVSSAAYMSANTVIEIIGDKCEAQVNDGFMRIYIENPSDKTLSVLEGFRLHITELSKEYRKQIRIITEV
ncbi:MAG: ribosomal-processing cysteine protease Prp [Clostridia bacterium]|nr:ribosomal-processing cysteine protease Prp [Clostridia bacterium]